MDKRYGQGTWLADPDEECCECGFKCKIVVSYYNYRYVVTKEELIELMLMENNIFELIRRWSKDRGLDKAEPKVQMIKLQEEVGELARAIIRNNKEEIADSIGDIVVVLTILTQQYGICNGNIENCIQKAYDIIKNRKGKLKDGAFIKDE